MVKLFDLCYSEYAWDSLSKWFIMQFYFTKTIETMQKKQRHKTVAFFDRIETLLSQTFCYSATFSLVSGELVAGVKVDSACLSFVSVLAVSVLASAGLTLD